MTLILIAEVLLRVKYTRSLTIAARQKYFVRKSIPTILRVKFAKPELIKALTETIGHR